MKTTKLFLVLLFVYTNAFSQCWTVVNTNSVSTIGLKTDGSFWGWGYNGSSILGLGLGSESFDTQFPMTQIGTANDWSSSYSLGYNHVLAIKTNGTLWSWGLNQKGQCGNGTFGNQNYVLAPQQIGTDNWQSVATGSEHSLAVKTDGTLWTWGWNTFGQLGTGNVNDQASPIQIGIESNWAKVYSTDRSSFAIKTDGTLWSWGNVGNGSNSSGALLGYNSTGNDYKTPHQVGTAQWLMISTYSACTLGIKADGTLWVWGENDSSAYTGYYGISSLPDTNNYNNNPTQIGTDTDWQRISATQTNYRALKNNGTLWGWGKNESGVLGDGTAVSHYFPIQLGTANNWIYLNSISSRIVGIQSDNSLYNWGFIYPSFFTTPTLNGTACSLNTTSFSDREIVKAYPNPSKDKITIRIEKTATQDLIISITNNLGQQLVSEKRQLADHEFSIDLSSYPSGLYYIHLTNGNQSYNLKIIKL